MKRPIKFRAWDSKDKMWLLAFMLHHDTGKIVGINHAYKNIHLMQYTGLKDKNGVEVYEGDIVKLIKGKNLKVIVWDESDACFDWKDANNNSWPDNFTGFIDEYEVIGNIYENPELLGNK